jgi:acetate kinase
MWLLQHGVVSVDELLETRSGLTGLSGTSGVLRDLLASRAAADPACALAFDGLIHQLYREIAAMTAAVGGLDALVFTGGIGEHAPLVHRVPPGARRCGSGNHNEDAHGDADISAIGAAVHTAAPTTRAAPWTAATPWPWRTSRSPGGSSTSSRRHPWAG